MRNAHYLFVYILIAISILGCGDDPVTDRDITPVEPKPLLGKIAFVSDLTGDVEIYTVNADGSALVRLTKSEGMDLAPSGSPDGQKLAFASERNGNFDIYVTTVDGTGSARQLTKDPANDSFPVWSPDGRKIAFISTRNGNDTEIFVMDADGSNLIQLTNIDILPTLKGWGFCYHRGMPAVASLTLSPAIESGRLSISDRFKKVDVPTL